MIVGAAAIVVLAAAAFFFWLHGHSVPAGEVAAFLDRTVGGGQVRFEVQKIDSLGSDAAGRKIAVLAKAWPVQPLFNKVDMGDYLRRTFQIDPDSTAAARSLLADKDSLMRPEFARARPFPPDPYLATLLQVASPAEVAFTYKGVVLAHGSSGAWSFSLVSGGFEGSSPQGEPRSAFGDATFIGGDAKDDARLRSQASDLQAFADRLAAVRRDNEAAHAATVAARLEGLLAMIAPGRVFAGKALEAGEQSGTTLYLEFTGLTAGDGVTALLRNDGGWHNARSFQGTWSADDESRVLTLDLASPASQAVHAGGPVLENTQDWTLGLSMDARGELMGKTRFFQYQFQPVLPAMVPGLKARLEAEYETAVAATEPGSLYQGTVASSASGKSETVLMRFTGRSRDGKSFEATIESPSHPWKRPLHGSIIDNARRSGGEPIRMRSAAKEALEDAPADSVIGEAEDLELSLGIREGALLGEDGRFTYQLAATGETDLQKLEAGRAERARRFMDVVRAGIAFDGTLREDQGFITHARLEFVRIDAKTGAVAAVVRSLARPNVYRDFLGTSDPSGGSLSLGAINRGAFGDEGSFDVPFLAGPVASTVHLELTGTSLSARIEGNPHWTMDFPAATFLSAPTESPEPGSPRADGSVFPAFPKAPGAYLLANGTWSAMPRNQGHIATETIKPKSDFKIPPNIVGAVNAGLAEFTKESDKKKVNYLEFPGKDPRPVSSGPVIIILFVGPEPGGKLPVELAPAEMQKDGQRWIELRGSSAEEVRLADPGLAAYVRTIAPGYLLFTTTASPASGPYVFNADAGYELTQE
jgi:hypothetical protein